MSSIVFHGKTERNIRRAQSLLFALLFSLPSAHSQTVPIGSWETHFNYLSAKHALKIRDRVFCASYNGLFSVDAKNEIKVWSKADSLHETGISSFAYDEAENLFIIAYRSGNLDLVTFDEDFNAAQIDPWRLLNETQGLPANKSIKRIVLNDGLAYLCTSFGIVVLNVGLRQVEETYRYIGSGGAQVAVTDIAFSADSLFAVTSQGILTASNAPSVNRQYFANWKPLSAPGQAVALATFNEALYAGFAGKGLFRRIENNWKSVYASNSKHFAIGANDNDLIVTLDTEIVDLNTNRGIRSIRDPKFTALNQTILTDTDTFWTADDRNGLLKTESATFHSITPIQADTTLFPRRDSTITDQAGLSWSRLPDYLGGGILVKSPQNQQQRVLSTNVGSGSLPSQIINSLALDQDGFVWFASDKGVGYIIPQDILGNSRVDAILPVYGQRKLFSTEKCTSLAIEPGNRKWIGTQNGLFLFNADGTELVQKFTAADSPLSSDEITVLQFEASTGKIFIETPNGMVSYQSNSTTPSEDLENVTIFPNPVRPGYGGQVGIKGLLQGSTIKITTVSGRLVFQTKSEGGAASWNLTDYTGHRARGGIYMVFIVSGDGNDKLAGKLAIIE